MAIDLYQEKQRMISTQDVYDILHFAAQSAEDNGFVNSFVFTRAIYAYAAIIFYPDRKEELAAKISNDLLGSWDELIEDGTIDKMIEEHAVDIDILGDTGKSWLEEYTEYAQSARGLLDSLQFITGDIAKKAVEQFNSATKDDSITKVLDIADKWGFNNKEEAKEEDIIKDNNKSSFEVIETKGSEVEDYPLFKN